MTNKDSLEDTLQYLRDTKRDLNPNMAGTFSEGFNHAVYLVAQMVLRNNNHQPCDCTPCFPELRSDEEWAVNRWVCADCGVPICNWGDEIEA